MNSAAHHKMPRPSAEKTPGPILSNDLRKAVPIAGVVLVLFFMLFGRGSSPTPLPAMALPAIQGSSESISSACAGKPRCLVAYLTPWCPACRGAISFVRDMSTVFGQAGRGRLVVIVGNDDPEAVSALASEIGGTVYLDTESTFKRAVGFSGVPQWLLVDDRGMIIDRVSSGGVSGLTATENIRYFLESSFSSGEAEKFGL